MNEIIKNEILELTSNEKIAISGAFVSIIDAIKSDIQNS